MAINLSKQTIGQKAFLTDFFKKYELKRLMPKRSKAVNIN